ncbi:1,2-phenylacetyl-CoA epoxidase subunit PaaD [Propionibacteriaceae bacterium Y1700]|uniref:1,2-phenylacetyl-CoA epoxidase subunit PaaD n=1 Tax=Microlunatus sp. Y1700 TaxID=3418487 RepID=UPI003DA70CAD
MVSTIERTLHEQALALAAAVTDPEIPVITIADLGVLRSVEVGDKIVVVITPTYSGCPAMDTIADDLRAALAPLGLPVEVRTTLAPAWTTDMITPAGRAALESYGIAPPGAVPHGEPTPLTLGVRCPQCGSIDTEELSRFGSTSCKALWRCRACAEPFDHFKTL